MEAVHLIGASGRSGGALARALQAQGTPVVPVVRDPSRWSGVTPRVADLRDPAALRTALADARRIVSCAHARHTASILAAAPADAMFVLLGSTRKFTRWPDEHGRGVLAGETAWLASGRRGVMLHPTMIYGAQGEDNVQRLSRLLRRLPVVPLPGGGATRIQPIHQTDVTRCVLAALAIDWAGPETLVIAGPEPVTYADFVRAVAHAAGLRPPRLVSAPAPLLMAAAALTRLIPGVPTIRPAEIRRLLEDKTFDIAPMTARLGVRPIGLAEGLATTFRILSEKRPRLAATA
ncbi:MAG TPA: NAD(P)H-binding protein [Acidisphaera sp.]|nr:NAD(P)H-binding protein [Acidisphaera sp.]